MNVRGRSRGRSRGGFRGPTRGPTRGVKFRGSRALCLSDTHGLIYVKSPILRATLGATLGIGWTPKFLGAFFSKLGWFPRARFYLVDISPRKKKFGPPPPQKKSPIRRRHPPGPSAPLPPGERPPPPSGIFNKKLTPTLPTDSDSPFLLPEQKKYKKYPKHPPGLRILTSANKGLPLPLGRGVRETKSKNGRSRPRKPFISRVFLCSEGD